MIKQIYLPLFYLLNHTLNFQYWRLFCVLQICFVSCSAYESMASSEEQLSMRWSLAVDPTECWGFQENRWKPVLAEPASMAAAYRTSALESTSVKYRANPTIKALNPMMNPKIAITKWHLTLDMDGVDILFYKFGMR